MARPDGGRSDSCTLGREDDDGAVALLPPRTVQGSEGDEGGSRFPFPQKGGPDGDHSDGTRSFKRRPWRPPKVQKKGQFFRENWWGSQGKGRRAAGLGGSRRGDGWGYAGLDEKKQGLGVVKGKGRRGSKAI